MNMNSCSLCLAKLKRVDRHITLNICPILQDPSLTEEEKSSMKADALIDSKPFSNGSAFGKCFCAFCTTVLSGYVNCSAKVVRFRGAQRVVHFRCQVRNSLGIDNRSEIQTVNIKCSELQRCRGGRAFYKKLCREDIPVEGIESVGPIAQHHLANKSGTMKKVKSLCVCSVCVCLCVNTVVVYL